MIATRKNDFLALLGLCLLSFVTPFVLKESIPYCRWQRRKTNGVFHSVSDDLRQPNTNQEILSLGTLGNMSSTISYFYLQDELGLSEEALWKITYEAGSVLEMKAGTIRRKVELLRETMGLSEADIVQILERQPTILQLSADKNLAPTMLFLLRKLELGRADLRQLILQEPSIICYATKTLNSKIRFFTQIMGFNISECRKIFLLEPKLFRSSAQNGLIPRFRFLLRDANLDLDQLRSIVLKYPRILIYSLDNLVGKMIFFFVMTLKMEPTQITKVLISFPYILDYNLERHIVPIFDYFIQDLGYQPTEFRSILLKFPRLVSHSLSKIKHVIGYLRFQLELEADHVKRIIFQAPQVVGLKDETLQSKVDFLQQNLTLAPHQLRKIITGMPTVLILSVGNNLVPKMAYLDSCFPHTSDLRDAVLRLPTLLGYSLDKRIKPRMEAILNCTTLQPGSITIAIPMKEESFVKWLDRRDAKEKDPETRGPPSPPDPSQRITHWTR